MHTVRMLPAGVRQATPETCRAAAHAAHGRPPLPHASAGPLCLLLPCFEQPNGWGHGSRRYKGSTGRLRQSASVQKAECWSSGKCGIRTLFGSVAKVHTRHCTATGKGGPFAVFLYRCCQQHAASSSDCVILQPHTQWPSCLPACLPPSLGSHLVSSLLHVGHLESAAVRRELLCRSGGSVDRMDGWRGNGRACWTCGYM